jgi:hypothetical protein
MPVKIDWKLLATFIFSIGIVFILGFLFLPNCSDCFRSHGWPFPYYREGGFGGGAHYVWGGMLGDFLFAVTASMFLWMGWNAALPRSVRGAERDIRRRSWGWIRLSYGLILVMDLISAVSRQVRGQIDPRLAPTNSAQLFGMVIAYVGMLAVAIWLAVTGIRKICSSSVLSALGEVSQASTAETANDHL